jgi:kynurenine formamidase
MTDQRIEFDFELEFTNGGGLSGTGFRLDVPSADVSDDWLADALVRDLRLLMVGPVRISNRRVIEEPHKRGLAGDGERARDAHPQRRLVDLSHPIEEGMTTYRGLPEPQIRPFLTREGSVGKYAPGVTFAIDVIEMCGNTGTYIDSPFHRHADGPDLAGLPLERLVDVPAIRVDVTGSSSPGVTARQLAPYDVRDRAVIVHTGFSRHWGTDAYFSGNPFLAADAVDHLVVGGAALVGIDSVNIDAMDDAARPAHSNLLAAGIPIVEHLTGLEQLPVDGFTFTALPAPFRGTGTFPIRAVATIPAD